MTQKHGNQLATASQRNKSSAVAEMGDRLAAIDIGRKLVAADLFFAGVGGELGAYRTQ